MMTQLITLQVDLRCVEKELAPKWFLRFRSVTFGINMVITTLLFFIFYSKVKFVQKKNDRNRITNIKNALELEDLDFIKMVDELKIDYDEADLREIEQEIATQIQKQNIELELQKD